MWVYMRKFVYVQLHIVCTSVWRIINAEQSRSVSNLVIRRSLTWTVALSVCNCVSLLPDKHSLKSKDVLPPWPAEVPGVCVGTEERVGACWWPLHCGSSALTGSQTKREKDTSTFCHTPMSSFHITKEEMLQTPCLSKQTDTTERV